MRLRVTPGAAANRIGPVAPGPDGAARLKVAVTAPAEKGKANAAVIKLLAKAWGVPKTSLSVVSGVTDRLKVVHIDGDPDRLAEAVAATVTEPGGRAS